MKKQRKAKQPKPHKISGKRTRCAECKAIAGHELIIENDGTFESLPALVRRPLCRKCVKTWQILLAPGGMIAARVSGKYDNDHLAAIEKCGRLRPIKH